MAGIGFLLRKLTSQDNFSGIIRAYFHSALVAVGPWIMIVCCLGAVSFNLATMLGLKEIDEFHSVFVYNVLFSFIFTAPVYMLSARYVADCLYRKNATPIPGILLTSLFYIIPPAVILASLFYVFYTEMTPFATLMSIINFVLLCEIWIVMLYLGCIRDFRAITLSWVVGMLTTLILAIYLGKIYGSTGVLLGLNIGFVLLAASLKANILAEYPYRFLPPKNFAFYFKYYKELGWSGFLLFSGMWVDKIIMWASSFATTHQNHLRTYPVYDGGMFFAYLTIIPVMALFIFGLETNFYDSYIQYIRNIETNAPYSLIEAERKNIIKKIIENGRGFVILQGSLTLTMIFLAPSIFTIVKIDFLGLSIFQIGTLGAFFAALNLFIVIFFSYFDSQRNMLIVTGVMFISNALFTLLSLHFGFYTYGYGYCFAMMLTFLIGAVLFVRFLSKLHYYIFISNVVKRHPIIKKELQE